MNPTLWCSTFVAMTLLDLAWVGYNRATAQGRTLASACWAACLAGLGGWTTTAIAEDPIYITATVCGAVVGTGVGLQLARWLERRRPDPREVIELRELPARKVKEADGIPD